MKTKNVSGRELESRFSKERIEYIKLDYLKGGDDQGGEPGSGPWPKP